MIGARTLKRIFAGTTLWTFERLPLAVQRLCERRARQATAGHMLPILWDKASDDVKRRFLDHIGPRFGGGSS